MRRTRLLAAAVVVAVLLTVGLREAAAAPAVFAHPGVLVSRAQLDFVRTQVNAGAQPWRAAYDQMMASAYASLSRTPRPRAVVECGSYSNPNLGCTDERQDALAAYTLAGLVRHPRHAVRHQGDLHYGRLVRGHHRPHQQQRAAPGRMGRFALFLAWETVTHASNPA